MTNPLQSIGAGLAAATHRAPFRTAYPSNIKDFSDALRALRHQIIMERQVDGPSFLARADTPRNFLENVAGERPEATTPRPERDVSGEDEVTPFVGVTLEPLALQGAVSPPTPVEERSRFHAGLEPIIAELVRSVAWGGDRRRGTVRLELGGRYAGTVLKIDASGSVLDIELDAPSGLDGSALGARLAERFAARGLSVDSLLIR